MSCTAHTVNRHPVAGRPSALGHSVGRFFGLNWSPNGQRIALVATPTQNLEQVTGVYIGDIGKTELQPLVPQGVFTQGLTVADPPPVWSLDNRAMAFHLGTPVINSSAGRGISIIEVTANTAKLIDDPTGKLMALGAGGNYLARGKGPVWSPDSQTIFLSQLLAAVAVRGCSASSAMALGLRSCANRWWKLRYHPSAVTSPQCRSQGMQCSWCLRIAMAKSCKAC